MKKLFYLAPVAGLAALLVPQAFATETVTVPATLGSTFLANVGAQIADTGTLTVIGIVIGLPLTFWLIKRVIGLVPKGK